MRTADTEILIVPGWTNSGPEHWQSRWQSRLPTARRVEQDDWNRPQVSTWVPRIVAAVRQAKAPTVIIAHSCGALAAVIAAADLRGTALSGLFLVAPPGARIILESEVIDHAFAHPPRDPLPVPSIVIASHTDPNCPILEAEEWAYAWGSAFVDAGDAGHIDTASGHGPWPEGLMRFAGFMKRLGEQSVA